MEAVCLHNWRNKDLKLWTKDITHQVEQQRGWTTVHDVATLERTTDKSDSYSESVAMN